MSRSLYSTLAHSELPRTRRGVTDRPRTTDTSLHSHVGALHSKGSINSKHKTVRSALSPPSPRDAFCTISNQRSYCREKWGVVVFRALTTSQGRSHFDFIGMSAANLRRVFALDVKTCPRAGSLHSTGCSPSTPI